MLWSKQYYLFDVDTWLKEHHGHPLVGTRQNRVRNAEWFHMFNGDIISMPDKWEYPWYAAWDLAFHTLALSIVDFDFAKEQLLLMLRSLYSHPNGQIPAYEWNFSDVNPPVHAWATLFLYKVERSLGREDRKFLERSFQGLMLNFNWWVNRKDPDGRNVFAGGFLGLDNIGVFDRSAPLPTGGSLEQADGTAWMAFYCQNMLEIALILADDDPRLRGARLQVPPALHVDCLRHGPHRRLRRRDVGRGRRLLLRRPPPAGRVGPAPEGPVDGGTAPALCLHRLRAQALGAHPRLMELIQLFRERHPDVVEQVAPTVTGYIGHAGRRLLSTLSKAQLERVLGYMLDENEFLSPYGIRSLSRAHEQHPFVLVAGGQANTVSYLPAESNTGMFGGNSNWRGPIWMPVNGLIVRGLLSLYGFYGDDFTVECPTGSGVRMTLFEVAREITRRLASIFLKDATGRRPVYGGTAKFQTDPHWRDLVLFYEYFHGDNGAGLGASHQTGWTGTIARLIDIFARLSPDEALGSSVDDALSRMVRARCRGTRPPAPSAPAAPAGRS